LQLSHIQSASVFPEYLIAVGYDEDNSKMQLIAFQDSSYVLVATLVLPLNLEEHPIRSPVICHQYFGRVRNKISVWAKERATGILVISEFDVDFGNPPREWFKKEASRHDTEIKEGDLFEDGKRCIFWRFNEDGDKGVLGFLTQRVETMHQDENIAHLLETPGPYNSIRHRPFFGCTLWREQSGTLVELDALGDIWVFRYGLP
jgi:hypothetical protein